MVSTPLTLAALATSAVSGLNVRSVRMHSANGEGDFTSAVVTADDGEFIIQIPQNAAAESRQSGEMLGVSAFAEGARSWLPFALPQTIGVTRAGETRAVVSTFLPGGRVSADAIESEALLLQPIAEMIAAIHQLPDSLVQQAGLPVRTSAQVREQLERLVARAAETRMLPETVHARWTTMLGTASLWDFAPVVIHGSLDADDLLVVDDTITGVLGWSELSTGDPAVDLAWLLEAGPEVFDAVLARYAVERGLRSTRDLRARSILHSELGVARWLLHGVETHDQSVIDDAISMLDRLVDRVRHLGAQQPARPVLSETEVQQMLDETPETGIDARTETAEYEALDEDRAFGVDRDFSGDSQPIGVRPADEQATEPISPLEESRADAEVDGDPRKA